MTQESRETAPQSTEGELEVIGGGLLPTEDQRANNEGVEIGVQRVKDSGLQSTQRSFDAHGGGLIHTEGHRGSIEVGNTAPAEGGIQKVQQIPVPEGMTQPPMEVMDNKKAMARLIRRATDGGGQIVNWLMEVVEGYPTVVVTDDGSSAMTVGPSTRERLDAMKILLDRGWGKPDQEVNIEVTHHRPLQDLDVEELRKALEWADQKVIDGSVVPDGEGHTALEGEIHPSQAV